MMQEWLSLGLLGAACSALMGVAFHPTWQEWRQPTDRAPLPIDGAHISDAEHFAHGLRGLATQLLGRPALDHSGQARRLPVNPQTADWDDQGVPWVAGSSLTTMAPLSCRSPLFVRGDLTTTEPASFTALLSEGEVRLAAHSRVLDWAHADQPLRLGLGCVALHRLSSRTAIDMANLCCFERLHAPAIRFGAQTDWPAPQDDAERIESSFINLDGVTRRSASLFMVQGDCRLPHGRLYRGSLVVTGRLYIGRHTQIIGDVKARGEVVLGRHAEVVGALCSDRQIQIREGAWVSGPVVSEATVLLGAQSRVGRLAQPTTVSATHVVAEAGSVVHGSVWAHRLGVVWSA